LAMASRLTPDISPPFQPLKAKEHSSHRGSAAFLRDEQQLDAQLVTAHARSGQPASLSCSPFNGLPRTAGQSHKSFMSRADDRLLFGNKTGRQLTTDVTSGP
jgi:hypothetical protein